MDALKEKANLTATQRHMVELWEKHLDGEFESKDTDMSISTMVEDPYVNHIPLSTGGKGKTQLHHFYSTYFIPQEPADMKNTLISRTVGENTIVDELYVTFTHDVEVSWMLPGLAPTGKKVEIALIVVVQFQDGKMASEHIYWDQATILCQLGLISDENLPIGNLATNRTILDKNAPLNSPLKKHVNDPIF